MSRRRDVLMCRQRTLDEAGAATDHGPMKKLARLLSGLPVFVLACAACSGVAQTTAPAPEARPEARSDARAGAAARQTDTLARIRELVGTPACSSDAQCRSLALGAKACGGPEGYLAWSTASTPEAELRALGDIHQAERRAAHAASGRISDCRFQPDPGAVCRAGTCQLGEAGPVAR
jgi:hypothetical protein